MASVRDVARLRVPAGADQAAALEAFAGDFARRSATEADAIVAMLCDEAIRQWRLTDATFWQRVKYRARHLRAVLPPSAGPDRGE